jgi:cation:H+ antiporter
MQIAVLAVVDMTALRSHALTFFCPHASLLLHGVLLVLLLAVAAAAIVGPDVALAGRVSPWSIALAVMYLLMVYHLRRYEGAPPWEPQGQVEEPPRSAADTKNVVAREHADATLKRIGVQFAGFSTVVLVGGCVVATTGEALAEQTGLGQTLIGATFVALATSLPEVSTTYNAVKFGAYSMAVGNILGTNALEIALLLPADLAYANGSIFTTLNHSSVLLAMVAIVGSLIYLWGMLERADRTVGNLGIDSAFVLTTYVGGMALFAALG